MDSSLVRVLRISHSECSTLNGTSVSTKSKQNGMEEPENGEELKCLLDRA